MKREEKRREEKRREEKRREEKRGEERKEKQGFYWNIKVSEPPQLFNY